MRNLFLLIVLLTFVASTQSVAQGYSYGQDDRANLQFGLKAGANYSNVYDSEGEEFDADAKFGFAGGIFVSVPVGTYFGFQPEALFSQRGFKATGIILGAPYELTRTINYIDLPLLLSIKPARMVTLLAGPQFSFLLNQRNSFESTSTTVEQEQEFENDNLRKGTLGVTAGLDFNAGNVIVGTRIGWDMFNNNGNGNSVTPRYKNTWVQGTIGFRF